MRPQRCWAECSVSLGRYPKKADEGGEEGCSFSPRGSDCQEREGQYIAHLRCGHRRSDPTEGWENTLFIIKYYWTWKDLKEKRKDSFMIKKFIMFLKRLSSARLESRDQVFFFFQPHNFFVIKLLPWNFGECWREQWTMFLGLICVASKKS